jgi:dTDP-4-dehydrorhamnose reductase
MGKLLVTGGMGTLGRALVRLAAEQGWTVRATWWRRTPDGPAEWVQADVRDAESVGRAVDGVDAVIHTAYLQGGEDEWATNVVGAGLVAAVAAPRRLIHLSTDVVFDGTIGRYREEDVPAPVNAYGRSKAEAELRVADTHPGATIARTSLIYGTPDGPQERLAREGRRFYVDELRSPVHVDDLAAALLELLALEVPGPLHVAGADDVTRYDFALLLGADPESIEPAQTSPERAPDVTLDSSQAARLLETRLRGVREVLADA